MQNCAHPSRLKSLQAPLFCNQLPFCFFSALGAAAPAPLTLVMSRCMVIVNRHPQLVCLDRSTCRDLLGLHLVNAPVQHGQEDLVLPATVEWTPWGPPSLRRQQCTSTRYAEKISEICGIHDVMREASDEVLSHGIPKDLAGDVTVARNPNEHEPVRQLLQRPRRTGKLLSMVVTNL